MTYLFLIVFMAVASAYAGGSLPGSQYLGRKHTVFGFTFDLTWLPEALFAIPFGVAFSMILDHFGVTPWVSVFCSIITATWSYIWMQTGHGVVLGFGDPRAPDDDPNRRQTLSPVVDWLADCLKIVKTQGDAVNSPTVAYCWLFMAVKGFLIALPVGGIVLAVLWPASHQAGKWLRNQVSFDVHFATEMLAGASAGVAIAVTWGLVTWVF